MQRLALLVCLLPAPAGAQWLTPAEQKAALPAICAAATWANRQQFSEPCQLIAERLRKASEAEAKAPEPEVPKDPQ